MGLVPPEHWPKLRVVRCSVDLERFPAIDRGGRTRAVEILSVGRAVPVKGQALLVEAVADLKRRGVEARLTIVGDGPALGDLRALAAALAVADSVSFEGAVGQEQILGYYERADVFALPSFAEGIPVVLMEAMATGLPVVSTTIAGIPELVDDGASGFLVTPGRVDELAGALERVLAAGAEERAEMGRVGRERVESEFATVRVAERLLELFREQAAVPCP
jgi:glycosyltransferase involved in cell wall biosynthesis